MTLDRRELAYLAIERLLQATPFFHLAARNRELLLEECETFPFALLNDGGETDPDQVTGAIHPRADLEIVVGVACDHRDQVCSALNEARAQAYGAVMGGWLHLPEAGELLINLEYRGCSPPLLAEDGAARGCMTLLLTMTYAQHELDAYAAG